MTDIFGETNNLWMNALKDYRSKDFKSSLALFEKAKSILGKDPVCELYISRCRDKIENPPENGWTGIFKLDS